MLHKIHMDILSQIVDYKKTVIASAKNILPEKVMQLHEKSRGFRVNIQNKLQSGETAIIAEIKKASPSKGVITESFDIPTIAQEYQEGGATCISVLTDEQFFHGHNQNIEITKQHSTLPVLRKDFIMDPYQIYESKHLGADAILLIASILDPTQMEDLEHIAFSLNLDVLVEVHTENELEIALKHTKSPLIGINNRNLQNFEISLQNTINLIKLLPAGKIPVCESGIETKSDINLMQSHNCNCFLIGTSIMKSNDRKVFIQKLLQKNS